MFCYKSTKTMFSEFVIQTDIELRTFLNIFVGDDDIRDLQNEHTSLSSETVVSIIPAIAGGSK